MRVASADDDDANNNNNCNNDVGVCLHLVLYCCVHSDYNVVLSGCDVQDEGSAALIGSMQCSFGLKDFKLDSCGLLRRSSMRGVL